MANYAAHSRLQLDGTTEDANTPLSPLEKSLRKLQISPPRGRPLLQTFPSTSSTRSAGSGSLASPDRFLARHRPTGNDLPESYRTNQAAISLTSGERLLRHADASPDAFRAVHMEHRSMDDHDSPSQHRYSTQRVTGNYHSIFRKYTDQMCRW